MLIAFNKPYGVLTQFTDQSMPPRPTLAGFELPQDVYAAGRLDMDSEGLLLLSDDGARIAQISSPKFKWPKTYLVQVEGKPAPNTWRCLRRHGSERRQDPAGACAHAGACSGLALAARSAGALPQNGAGILAGNHHQGRPQPAGPADDGGGRPALPALGAHLDRPASLGRLGARRMARRAGVTFPSASARLGPVRGRRAPRVFRPGMARVADLHFPAHFGIGAVPEIA